MADVPEPTELLYTPQPSWLPVFVALGFTLIVVGLFGGLLVPGWVYSVLGAVIFLRALWLWVRDATRDYTDLPREQRPRSAVLPALHPRRPGE